VGGAPRKAVDGKDDDAHEGSVEGRRRAHDAACPPHTGATHCGADSTHLSLIAVASDAQGTGQWQGAARRYLQGHEVELPRLVREHFTEAGNIVISLVETSTKSLVSLIVFVVGVFHIPQ
jgi:hypothetical protein